jgi:hypothetical protein
MWTCGELARAIRASKRMIFIKAFLVTVWLIPTSLHLYWMKRGIVSVIQNEYQEPDLFTISDSGAMWSWVCLFSTAHCL